MGPGSEKKESGWGRRVHTVGTEVGREFPDGAISKGGTTRSVSISGKLQGARGAALMLPTGTMLERHPVSTLTGC